MPSPTQQRGSHAEDRAAQFLEGAGLTIIGRNLRCRGGELDLVARQGDVLVIAEVRQRAGDQYGGAAASIGWMKQRRLVRATQYFLTRYPEWGRLRLRFDALLLDQTNEIVWIKNAFDASA